MSQVSHTLAFESNGKTLTTRMRVTIAPGIHAESTLEGHPGRRSPCVR